MRLPVPFVFVLGPPGSGKSTQCSLICQEFSSVLHLSAGEAHVPSVVSESARFQEWGTAEQHRRGQITCKFCVPICENIPGTAQVCRLECTQ